MNIILRHGNGLCNCKKSHYIIDKNNVNEIGTFKKKLIVIDRADVIITPDVGQIINSDFGINRYLIFARTFIGVEISPNYYATVVRTGKELTLKYMFSVKGGINVI